MNNNQLIEKYANENEVSKAEAKRIIESVIRTIADGAKENGKCAVPGLGKLELVHVEERSGKAPKTQKPYTTPAHNKFKFTSLEAGKQLANA
jgi:DNA-binding protein HU-beta